MTTETITTKGRYVYLNDTLIGRINKVNDFEYTAIPRDQTTTFTVKTPAQAKLKLRNHHIARNA